MVPNQNMKLEINLFHVNMPTHCAIHSTFSHLLFGLTWRPKWIEWKMEARRTKMTTPSSDKLLKSFSVSVNLSGAWKSERKKSTHFRLEVKHIHNNNNNNNNRTVRRVWVICEWQHYTLLQHACTSSMSYT